MKISIVNAQMSHVQEALDDIRPADLREWYAGTGNLDFASSLHHVFAEGRYSKSALGPDGRLLCMWGVDQTEYMGVGSVWMFATVSAERHAISLHRELIPEVGRMMDHSGYDTLEACADSRNVKHHVWLVWMGFKFVQESFMGPFGLPFKQFIFKR